MVKEDTKSIDNGNDKERSFDKFNSDKNNNRNHDNKNNNNSNGNINSNSNNGNNNTNVNSNQGKRNGGNNNRRPEFTGSIINRTGNKIHFPGYLKKKYCANFIDTEETCNRGTSYLLEHALFPSR